MADADIFALFGGAPTATQEAQALAEAMRRRREAAGVNRGLAMVTSLGANPLLAGLNRSATQAADALGQEAGQGESMLATAGSQGAGRALQEVLAQRAQAAQARENALGRAAQRELAGITDARERDRMAAENERARIKAEGDKAKGQDEGATNLRKEINALPEVKDYQMLSSAFDKLQTVSKTPGRAADLAMIFSFMQMLDPGVSVMEGDVQNVKNSSGQMDNAINTYRRVFNGDTLTDAGRESIMQQAAALHGTARKRYDDVIGGYSDLAKRRGLPVGDVILRPPAAGGGFTLDTSPAPAGQGAAVTPQPDWTPVHDPKTGKLLGYLKPDGGEVEVP